MDKFNYINLLNLKFLFIYLITKININNLLMFKLNLIFIQNLIY